MSRRAAAARRGMPPAIGVSSPSDRRFRRPDVRPAGRGALGRRSRRLVAIAAAILVLAGLGAWTVHTLLTTPWLVVRQLTVHGTHRLQPGEVESLVADLRHENILRVDLDRYHTALLGSPWIDRATLHRELPATVVIDVHERVPVVFAHLGDRLFLVDEAGAVIDEVGPQYRDLDLPVVDGLATPGATPGSAVDPWRVTLVDRCLTALSAVPALRARVSEVDITDPHDITVMLEGDSTVIKLGDTHFVDRLQRYLTLAPALRRSLADLEYVDVRFDNLFVMPRGHLPAPSRPGRRP